MPFWLHEHKIMLFCKGQPLRYKVIATGTFLGLLGLGWFIGILTPWKWDLDQKRRTHATLLEQKKIFEPIIAQQHGCFEQYNQLKQKHESLLRIRSLQHITSSLLAFMHKNNVACGGILQGQAVDKGLYQRNEITFLCKGEYCNILSFLKTVDESKLAIDYRVINLHKSKTKPLVCKLIVRVISAKEEAA